MNPVYLTSAGTVCHAGRGLDALTQGLREPVVRPVSRVLEVTRPATTVSYLPAMFSHAGERVVELIEAAVADALDGFSAPQRQGMALFIAGSSFDLLGHEDGYVAAIGRGEPALAWPEPTTGLLASRVAEKFGIDGGQFTINTACSSGVQALMYAAAMIRRGDCKRALVVGVECPGRVTLAGFHSLLLVTRDQCRPFDRNRDGLILGEAAAAMVLDTQREGPCFTGMQLLGAATACEPTSTTQNNPDAVRTLINAALRNAGVDRVDAIKAHGTGTPGNDLAEAVGVAACLGSERVPITSLKSALGHTLGACGVMETLAMAACWRAGYVPPTAGFQQPDPALDITPLAKALPLPPGRMLLNYLGFGGNNGALVLGYAP